MGYIPVTVCNTPLHKLHSVDIIIVPATAGPHFRKHCIIPPPALLASLSRPLLSSLFRSNNIPIVATNHYYRNPAKRQARSPPKQVPKVLYTHNPSHLCKAIPRQGAILPRHSSIRRWGCCSTTSAITRTKH